MKEMQEREKAVAAINATLTLAPVPAQLVEDPRDAWAAAAPPAGVDGNE
jgi:hypothetical protein